MSFSWAVIFIGLFSIFSQSIFIRRLICVFYGNELTTGIFFSSWLLFGGIGSFVFSKILHKIKNNLSFFSLLIILFSLLSLLEFLFIKSLKIIFGIYPGQIPDLSFVFVATFLIIAPFSFLNGFLFSFTVKICSQYRKEKAIAQVYALDALGDMLGGILFSFLCVYLFSPLENIYFINLIFILFFFIFFKKNRKKIGYFLIFLLLLGIFLKKIDTFLTKKEWKGFEVMEKTSSFYADLVLIKQKSLYSLFGNGVLNFSFPLKREKEAIVSLAFLETKLPRNILIIGEGVADFLSEILKHKEAESIYYLELDPKIIETVKKYLPQEDRKALTSKKVKIIHQEARVFLTNYQGKKFDIIFLNTAPPLNLYLNRFYTVEFFKKLKSFLNQDGILTLSIPSKESYLSQELRDWNACIYHTLGKVFSKIILIPGENLRFIASDSDYLTQNPDELAERFLKRNFPSSYINQYYFYMKLIPWHINYVTSVLKTHRAKENKDFEPIAYFYGISYFTSYFKSFLNKILTFLSRFKIHIYLAIFSLILFLSSFRKKIILPLTVFISGFSAITCVIFSILGFQIIYGYVYHKIGLINAFFMLGIVIGSYFYSSFLKKKYKEYASFILTTAGFLFFILPPLFRWLSFKPYFYSSLFYLIPLLEGILTGIYFPLANSLYLSKSLEVAKGASLLYACDLLGGALGGIMLSVVFLPLYGIIKSCNFIGLILVESAIFLYFSLKR